MAAGKYNSYNRFKIDPFKEIQVPETVYGTIGESADHQLHPPGKPLFFSISPMKLTLMSICSGGIYLGFWYFMNWKLWKDYTKEDISVFWRWLFAIIYFHPLLKRIKKSGKTIGLEVSFAPLFITILDFALFYSYDLPDPYWIISFLTFLPILLVQETINQINEKVDPGGNKNDRYSVANILLIIVGGFFVLLAYYGAFLPDEF